MKNQKNNNELEQWLQNNQVVNKDSSLKKHPVTTNPSTQNSEALPSLDLHGFRVAEALSRLKKFLALQPPQIKKVLIIHGKGNHSEDSEGILKEEVQNWLRKNKPTSSRIKDFSFAKPSLGGNGATLVWLR